MAKKAPKIYSKKLSAEQNDALERYESLCGLEPFGINDFETGEITAYQLWQQNVFALQSILADVSNINFPVPSDDPMGESMCHG